MKSIVIMCLVLFMVGCSSLKEKCLSVDDVSDTGIALLSEKLKISEEKLLKLIKEDGADKLKSLVDKYNEVCKKIN